MFLCLVLVVFSWAFFQILGTLVGVVLVWMIFEVVVIFSLGFHFRFLFQFLLIRVFAVCIKSSLHLLLTLRFSAIKIGFPAVNFIFSYHPGFQFEFLFLLESKCVRIGLRINLWIKLFLLKSFLFKHFLFENGSPFQVFQFFTRVLKSLSWVFEFLHSSFIEFLFAKTLFEAVSLKITDFILLIERFAEKFLIELCLDA